MGYGSYRSSDWAAMRKERKITESSTLNELYTATEMNTTYDPSKIAYRESRDSKASPVSTPIILGLDVTGSMGYLSTEIAKEHLNKTILDLYDKKPVLGPQILFAAIGDSKCDSAPLQVTQFESDIRIAQQLLDLWFEGRGGDMPESFHLAWWFALNHTRTDADEKRHEKGFLFTIGDAPCHDVLTAAEIRKVFGDNVQQDYTTDELYRAVSEKYNTFHINLDTKTDRYWEKLMPGHAILLPKRNIDFLSDVIVATIRIACGENKKDVVLNYDTKTSEVLAKALVHLGGRGRLSF